MNTYPWAALLLVVHCAGAQAQAQAQVQAAPRGADLYAQYCAPCHSARVNRAPDKWFLQMMSPANLRRTLDEGVMREQASSMNAADRGELVAYLTANAATAVSAPLMRCDRSHSTFDFRRPPSATGWGFDPANARFVPGEVARLTAGDVPRLKLRWAFAYPQATRARSQPSIAAGAVMVGSQDGTVYALDEDTGCVRWTYRAGAEVRTGLTLTNWRSGVRPIAPRAYFADLVARVYAIDARTGRELWVRKVEDDPHATITAQPVLHAGRLYVSVSSREVVAAADPKYPCCTFRGSVVALDAGSGRILWQAYPIAETPRQVGVTTAGTSILAPSGAPVWNSPTVDEQRGLIFFGTGQNYSAPSQGSSDAIVAVEIATGRTRWIRQATAGDAWNAACIRFLRDRSNCPQVQGFDFDFGSPPILVRGPVPADDILVAGQKSGVVWGIDPDTGAVRWQQRVGRGGDQGGEHFGMAAEGARVFVPITDNDAEQAPAVPRPGLHAVDAFTGAPLWSTLADEVCAGRKYCDRGISAAVTAIPGVVFAGHLDGRLRAYDSTTGRVIWEFDTAREFPSVSGDTAHGGAIAGAGGPVVVDGRVFVNSGYGYSYHMPGNALLVFSPDGR